MNQILKIHQKIQLGSGTTVTVREFLGGGGQGEVYRVQAAGTELALKWYFPHQATHAQRRALESLIRMGPPDGRFLWPLETASDEHITGFGYVMPLRDPAYKSIIDLMRRRAEPDFRALATAGFQLADSYLQLHSRGLSYRDISFGNVFFNPQDGQVLVCDNDNVSIDGSREGGVLGTPRFMAPEIVRGESGPSTESDLFSLAVLLFYMLMVHHPLEGRSEAEIRCFDLPAMTRLYGTDPVFIFDPEKQTNRPVPGLHDNAIVFWPLYPSFIQALFTRAFTKGLNDPDHGRVRESEWRAAMVRLRDSIVYCAHCGSENFYDQDAVASKAGPDCWACGQHVQLPPRIRIDEKRIVMLNHNTILGPHHVNPQQPYVFEPAVADVRQHPQDPGHWGLRNLAEAAWAATTEAGRVLDVAPGRSVSLVEGVRIEFGSATGEIKT
jgi:DNA-binding helix-hairpin-helix protein with protein kinase domain